MQDEKSTDSKKSNPWRVLCRSEIAAKMAEEFAAERALRRAKKLQSKKKEEEST